MAGASVDFLTFRQVAERMQSSDARIYPSVPYWNRRGLEGTSVGFYHFCEWFEINVHDAQALSPEAALKLIEALRTLASTIRTGTNTMFSDGSVARGSRIIT